MARGQQRQTPDATVETQKYAEAEGFEAGNRAPSSKYRDVDGNIVDDLKGEPGWEVVVKGDVVTPAMADELNDSKDDDSSDESQSDTTPPVDTGRG
jgi:hypothetical protein